jgi:GPH family glycoside/pentoside/hexuronide:cation symporter
MSSVNLMPHANGAPAASHFESWAYGLLALPLAFVALPMYVNVPHFYASQFAVPLSLLGAVLLCSRLVDAFTDPLLGRLSDVLYARSRAVVMSAVAVFSLFLALAFAALFHPPQHSSTTVLLAWVALWVTLCHLAFSMLSILHQAWATRLGGGAVSQARVLAWRESAGLLGVVMASLLPVWTGWTETAWFLAFALLCAMVSWQHVFNRSTSQPKVAVGDVPTANHSELKLGAPFKEMAFIKLLTVFVVNGIASAIPASLVLFFIEDQIKAPPSSASLYLGVYFLSGALSLPVWLYAIQRFDLPRTWLAGMLLAVCSFVGVSQLGAGDEWAYFWVCLASGTALGADLVVPGAMLNGLVDRLGHRGRFEGLYLGWWNLATKFNLAMAAGLSLPLLGWWGYRPGTQDETGLMALTWAYGALPCALKLCAVFALYVFWIRPASSISRRPL